MSIWLSGNVCDSLVDCKISAIILSRLILNIPLRIASASLSGISMLNSSSIAITTSTVSKLSNPKSFEKCAFAEICICQYWIWSDGSHRSTLDLSPTWTKVNYCITMSIRYSYLVEVVQQIHYSSLNLLLWKTWWCRIESYALDGKWWCCLCRLEEGCCRSSEIWLSRCAKRSVGSSSEHLEFDEAVKGSGLL